MRSLSDSSWLSPSEFDDLKTEGIPGDGNLIAEEGIAAALEKVGAAVFADVAHFCGAIDCAVNVSSIVSLVVEDGMGASFLPENTQVGRNRFSVVERFRAMMGAPSAKDERGENADRNNADKEAKKSEGPGKTLLVRVISG